MLNQTDHRQVPQTIEDLSYVGWRHRRIELESRRGGDCVRQCRVLVDIGLRRCWIRYVRSVVFRLGSLYFLLVLAAFFRVQSKMSEVKSALMWSRRDGPYVVATRPFLPGLVLPRSTRTNLLVPLGALFSSCCQPSSSILHYLPVISMLSVVHEKEQTF